MYGTPVMIYLKNGTRGYEGVAAVTLNFGGRERAGIFWSVFDFTLPVMNVEPQAVTLFVSGRDQEMLIRLRTALKQGSFEIVPGSL
jgi:hypothetical protein